MDNALHYELNKIDRQLNINTRNMNIIDRIKAMQGVNWPESIADRINVILDIIGLNPDLSPKEVIW